MRLCFPFTIILIKSLSMFHSHTYNECLKDEIIFFFLGKFDLNLKIENVERRGRSDCNHDSGSFGGNSSTW